MKHLLLVAAFIVADISAAATPNITNPVISGLTLEDAVVMPVGATATPSHTYSGDTNTGISASAQGGLMLVDEGESYFEYRHGNVTDDTFATNTTSHAMRIYPIDKLSGADRATGLFCRLPGDDNSKHSCIHLETSSEHEAGDGVLFRMVHNGSGDGFYMANYGSQSKGLEHAAFEGGTAGFISTLQWSSSAEYKVHDDFDYNTLFSGIWGYSDAADAGATSAPAYGAFLLHRSLGNAFVSRLQEDDADGFAWGTKPEFRITEFDYGRDRFAVYNNGNQINASTVATAGSTTETAPSLTLRGSFYSGSATNRDIDFVPSLDGAGAPALAIRTGASGAEVTRLSLSATGAVVTGIMSFTGNGTFGSDDSDQLTFNADLWNLTYDTQLKMMNDISSGDFLTITTATDAELTASTGVQVFTKILAEVDQSGDASAVFLQASGTLTGVGSGQSYIFRGVTDGAVNFTIETDGDTFVGPNGNGTITAATIDDLGTIVAPDIDSDLGATCTVGTIAIDTGGATKEFCYCESTDSWICAALAAGPAD